MIVPVHAGGVTVEEIVPKEYEFDGPTWSSDNDVLCSVSELVSASTLRECGNVIH